MRSNATLAKLVPLGLFIVLAFIAFRLDVFTLDFSGIALGVPVWEQVKNTMLITLWVFIGVEGAVVVSARARNKRDVGRATLLAVLAALGVYLFHTVLINWMGVSLPSAIANTLGMLPLTKAVVVYVVTVALVIAGTWLIARCKSLLPHWM